MSKGKLLSFHNLVEGEGFVTSSVYRDEHINSIPDPEGGNTNRPPTSIPSPFQVIDLAATAFDHLAVTKTLTGNNIYEKIVSQSLDVGMAFYSANTLRSSIGIIDWEKKEQLSNLLSSSHVGHRILGKTLNMFLTDDAHEYNFSDLQNTFLIEYKYNIIGCTSTKTLFCCSLNPLEQDKRNQINLGDEILFGETYVPLYKRPEEFQFFMYALAKQIPRFIDKCPELNSYLEKNKKILRDSTPQLYDRIMNLSLDSAEKYFKQFQSLETGKSGSFVNVLGVTLISPQARTEGKSDFKIQTKKTLNTKTPLVLFPGFGGQNAYGQSMTYFDGSYSRAIDQAIPYHHSEPDISKRELPGLTSITYPYLLVDDLLEPELIRLEDRINSAHFYDNRLDMKYGFLCPLKKEVFTYFDVQDIMERNMPDGKPMFELEATTATSVIAHLRIPVVDGYVTLSKTYQNGDKIDESRNMGIMKTIRLGVSVYPFYKPDESEKEEYRTFFISLNGDGGLSGLELFNQDAQPIPYHESQPIKDQVNTYKTVISKTGYDFIQIKVGNTRALVLPKWKPRPGKSKSFHFAIDFGTTNTHIEYKINKESSSFNQTDESIGSLVSHGDFERSVTRYFIPSSISNEEEYHFPFRTVLATNNKLDFITPTYPLADARIPFYYHCKAHQTATSNYELNLKWTNFSIDHIAETKVALFLEQLVIMMRNKVVSEGGRPEDTDFTYCYPSSMGTYRIKALDKLWSQLIQKHFDVSEDRIHKISESIAPFMYYIANERIDSHIRPVMSIDIGGGTSDLVIFKDNVPTQLTSFRYAANTLFGDGYNSNVQQNGFVQRHVSNIKQRLENLGKSPDTDLALDSIQGFNSSPEIVSFLFSLLENKQLRSNNSVIDFAKMLSNDEDLKSVILLYFYALIHYIAFFTKKAGAQTPGVIVFSGNGSKLLRILDQGKNLESLTSLTHSIFELVHNEQITHRIDLKLHDEPKVVTAKGGLYIKSDSDVNIKDINEVVLGSEEAPESMPSYSELSKSHPVVIGVVEEVNRCLGGFIALADSFDYGDEFGVSPSAIYKCKTYLSNPEVVMKWLLVGINERKEESQGDGKDKVEETLFFHPFQGILNDLAYLVTNTE